MVTKLLMINFVLSDGLIKDFSNLNKENANKLLQTVLVDTKKRYHDVISKFKEKTGWPLVVNTSFNVCGEPIICTPTDTFKCFMGTEMDMLVIENYLFYKEQQDVLLKENYKERYEMD